MVDSNSLGIKNSHRRYVQNPKTSTINKTTLPKNP